MILYVFQKQSKNFASNYLVDTGCKLNVHKTFRRRPGCSIYVLCLRSIYNFAVIPKFSVFVIVLKRSYICYYIIFMIIPLKEISASGKVWKNCFLDKYVTLIVLVQLKKLHWSNYKKIIEGMEHWNQLQLFNKHAIIEGTVFQIENALTNDRFRFQKYPENFAFRLLMTLQ